MGFPITVLNTIYTYHIIIKSNSIVVTYKGSIDSYSYFSIFMDAYVCNAATYHSYTITTNLDKIIINHVFYLSLGNLVYQIKVGLTFAFSSFSNHF